MSWSAPHVPRGDLKRLANATNRLRGFHGRGAQDRINAAIAGKAGPEVAQTIASLEDQRMLGMDSVSAALLADHGVDAGAVAALRCSLYSFTVRKGVITVARIETPMSVRIGTGDAWWHPDSNTIGGLDQVPETLAGEMAGRPLHAFLTHPVLDPLGLVIEEVEVTGATRVRVSGSSWLTTGLAKRD